MEDIAIAVACYYNEKEVIKYAESLSRQSVINRIRLLVTCNACNNYEWFRDSIHNILPTAKVFNPQNNLGYLSGCLYGVIQSTERYSWVVVSNTDIEFEQNDFFEKLIDNVGENIWCVGPDIILSQTGVHQNPFLKERPSKRKVMTWKVAYSAYPLFWLYFKLHDLKPKTEFDMNIQDGEVYAVHGSFFCLRYECAQKIIEEQSGIFMYGEELMIAEIVNNNKKKTIFNNEVKVIHNENQVTGRINNRKKQEWFKTSINYLYNRFYR